MHVFQFLIYAGVRTFSLTWNNIGKTVGTQYQVESETGAKQYRTWANAIAVFNRVPGICMTDTNVDELEKAQHIRLQEMLPNHDSWALLKSRMVILAQRTLAKFVPCFHDVKVSQYIPHEFSKESSRKSEIVRNLLPLDKLLNIMCH